MKEITLVSDFNFSNSFCRENIIKNDKNFVYGHFQIGEDYLNRKFGKEKNINVGFATVGGFRIGNLLYYAVSLCSPKDNFSRVIGRNLVEKNMICQSFNKKRGVVDISLKLNEQPSKILKYALEDYLMKGKKLPLWTKQPVFYKNYKFNKNLNNFNLEKQNKNNEFCNMLDESLYKIKKETFKNYLYIPSLKGWETRRNNENKRKLSEAALMGWETRRNNKNKRKLSEAALKGWKTRRNNKNK